MWQEDSIYKMLLRNGVHQADDDFCTGHITSVYYS